MNIYAFCAKGGRADIGSTSRLRIFPRKNSNFPGKANDPAVLPAESVNALIEDIYLKHAHFPNYIFSLYISEVCICQNRFGCVAE